MFTCVGLQVTLCDPIWQVTSRSCEMGFVSCRAICSFNSTDFVVCLLLLKRLVVDSGCFSSLITGLESDIESLDITTSTVSKQGLTDALVFVADGICSS